MNTSIKIIPSIFFFCFLSLFQKISAQEYFWESKNTPDGINTTHDEFNLVLFDKQIMFTRMASGFPRQFIYNGEGSIIPYSWNQTALKEMHIVYPMKLESTIYFSSTYQTLKRAYLGIFELRDNTILNPLGQNEPGSFASHPWISSDGQTLFFSSDREGGIGGADLWYYEKGVKGDWIGPYRMPEYINSSGNEINPFSPHPDTLYYSTNGHGGKGGYDILMSIKEKGTWLEPVPLDEVNSEWNDMEFTILNDSEAAFTSDRPGGKGNLDIYMLKKSQRSISTATYITLTPTIKLIEQDIEKVANSLAFRTFIFPHNNKLSVDDDAMIQKLGDQLLKNQDAKVYMSIHPMTYKIIDKFRASNIPDSQILIDSSILESMIIISMNSKEMYAPHPRIGSNCHPQSMQVHISSVPENLIEEWEISVHDSTLKKGRILPDSIQYNVNFNIAPFQDSIVFHAKGSNLMGMEINDSLIIPIKRHIVDLSETIDTNSIPVIWHMKEMKAILPHFIRYATCFKKYPAEISEKDKAHPYQNHIRLFVSEYNAIAVDNVIKMLSNEPLLKEFTFSKIELHQNHKLARMIRSTISRVQSEEYGNVIPVLIE